MSPPQIFYLPLALVAPPAIFAVHIQLNLLYQFWIHTEVAVQTDSVIRWTLLRETLKQCHDLEHEHTDAVKLSHNHNNNCHRSSPDCLTHK